LALEKVILALDPGKTTGFAIYKDDKIKPYQIDLFQYPRPHEILFHHLDEIKPDILTYEQFRFRQGMLGTVYTGIEMIGVINLWVQINKVEVDSISSSEGKAFWDDKKLKALGYYQRGLTHGMDATRVLCVWLNKNNKEWMDDSIRNLRSTLRIV
jgi:hypothetical protein